MGVVFGHLSILIGVRLDFHQFERSSDQMMKIESDPNCPSDR